MLISKLLIDIDWDDLDLIVKMLPLAAQIMMEWRRERVAYGREQSVSKQGKDDEVHYLQLKHCLPLFVPANPAVRVTSCPWLGITADKSRMMGCGRFIFRVLFL